MAHHILVNERQRGNPVLDHLRNVPWQFSKGLIPDYVFSANACCLFISVRQPCVRAPRPNVLKRLQVRYHLLKPK